MIRMKTKFRTSRKILSLFLCILMAVGFMPYYAVQNKAQAVTASSPVFYWHNLRSVTMNDRWYPYYALKPIYSKEDSTLRLSFSNVATPATGSWSDTGSYSDKTSGWEGAENSAGNLGTRNFTVTAYYDYRVGATNYNPSWTIQDYHLDCPDYRIKPDDHWYKNETVSLTRPGAVAAEATTGTKTTGSKGYSGSFKYTGNELNQNGEIYDSSTSQFNYTFNIYWTYYGCNTTELYNYYNECYDTYGLTYNAFYTTESWTPYVEAMNKAKPVYTSGATQETVVQKLNELKEAVANLELRNVNVSTLFVGGEGFDYSNVPEKVYYYTNLEFDVDLHEGYTQSVPTATVNGSEYDGEKTDDDTYHFTIPVETSVDSIVVNGVKKNTYPVAFPSGTGYSASCDTTIYDPAAIEHGTYLAFAVALDEQYNRSVPVVKYNGTLLEPTDGGIYTVKVTNEIKPGEITVENVELNHYYITLPLETETGFTIIVGDGLNAKSVLSGTDFDFKFFLDPAYSNSNPVIKYSADGGDHYKVLTEEDGKYTIENVLSDCIVVVEGIKKNTYTVNFLDGNGDIAETVENVEYGSEVKYPGKNDPAKDAEPISDSTDPETGVRTVVTKEYKFIGWSQDTTNVTSNMEVSPVFEVLEVTKTYPNEGGDPAIVVTSKTANILFISGDLIVHKETATKGEGFSGWDGVPVKTSSNPYETYTFIGWDTDRDGVVDFAAGESNAIADVQNDVTFTAVFESNLPSQTVNFYNFDGSELLYSASVKRGEKAEYGLSGSPERRDDANLYDFAGWALTTDADETEVVEKLIVGENNIDLYAAYKKTPIVYSYKYVDYDYDKVTGEPEPFQEGSFYYGDRYKYLGSTPVRASSVSTDYTFDGWDVAQSGYTSVYTATYSESVREYDSKLPTPDTTYTITENKTVKYGDTFSFTVTLAEGYEETAPVVTSNGTAIEPASKSGNSYTYEIKLDGATAEEVYGDLTVTVGTTINVYDVAIGGDSGCTVDPLFFNAAHGGEGSFIVTVKEGYTQTEPKIGFEGDVAVDLVSNEGNVYTYKVTGIKSDAAITVKTTINEYLVVMTNYDGKDVFNGNVKHGEAPVYETPTKPSDENGKYDFIGWDTNGDGEVDVTNIENVTAPVTATAVYKYNHEHTSDPADPDSVWELDESKTTKKATCTEPGMKYYVCKHCGEVTKEVVIPARTHNLTEWHIDKAPTCTETGLKSRYCQNTEATEDYEACNHKEENVVVPATGHHDSDGDYICDDCGFDLGHCSKCICHKNNILSKILRYTCTLLTKIFHKPIKCCKCMDWYNGNISSIS